MYDTKMNIQEKKKKRDELALAVFTKIAANPSNLQNVGQILTKSERVMIGRRLLIAQAILTGKTRRELQIELGISPNTFAQVNRWLEEEFKEYDAFTVSKKMDSASNRSGRSKYVQPFSYEHLKRSYPAHFLLFSIAEAVWKQAQKQTP